MSDEIKARLNSPGGWGQVGSVDMLRYMEPTANKRRRCKCGCRGAVTHRGMANGVTLMGGCEVVVRRWVRVSEAELDYLIQQEQRLSGITEDE